MVRNVWGALGCALSAAFSGKEPVAIVRAFARHLHAIVGLPGPAFDPFRYAKALQLRVERGEIQADGLLAGWPGADCRVLLSSKKQTYQSLAARRRENFTLAHEIGHFVIRENLNGLVPRSMFERESPEEERLCNVFAEELLMPYQVIRKDFAAIGTSPRRVLEVAEVYDVSLSAVLRRLSAILKYDYLIIMWQSHDGQYNVEWASPRRYKRSILCDSGRTSVERAFASEEAEGRDSILLNSKREHWHCSSLRINGGKVLSVSVRPGHPFATNETHFSQVTPPPRFLPVQMVLPLGA